MQVIPVIDLLRGQVVRGIGGRRTEYRPVQSSLAADPSPHAVATAFAAQFGFQTAYVADLDAIMHQQPDCQSWQTIASCGLDLWLDAGVGALAEVQRTWELAAACRTKVRLVVGLETLASEQQLAAIAAYLPDAIFSLDLVAGAPKSSIAAWKDHSPVRIAQTVFEHGLRDLIVLDLADVGTRGGTRTLELCRQLRRAGDVRQIIAGGGVRHASDLVALADAGCDAALVASALHDGQLSPADLRRMPND
jgi:phosphoribosylformimino-5-aminoimidazole carboxamide ribotide isomerase